ncbi:MAG: hypothetical protein ACXAC2_00255 [Candidatus Kariarchaeaceae archaeon]|jgi:hypothetical protein
MNTQTKTLKQIEQEAFKKIKGKTLNESTQILYNWLKTFQSEPKLNLRHFQSEINNLTRLHTHIIKYDWESLKRNYFVDMRKYDTGQQFILYELTQFGDATRVGLIKAMEDKHSVKIPRSTIYDRLIKLVNQGWVSRYKVKSGRIGSTYSYYRFNASGVKEV